MYKVINIGEEQVAFLAKASTNLYFKEVFHQDPIALQSNEEAGNAERIDFTQKLPFIMSKQADAQDAVTSGKVNSIRDFMQKVTEDDFFDWLDRFDFMDLQDALAEAMGVYTANHVSTSKAKK